MLLCDLEPGQMFVCEKRGGGTILFHHLFTAHVTDLTGRQRLFYGPSEVKQMYVPTCEESAAPNEPDSSCGDQDVV